MQENIQIRDIENEDSEAVNKLLRQLGYNVGAELIGEKLQLIRDRNDYKSIVAEIQGKIVAYITMHFSTLIGYKGEILNISYFVVDENFRGKGVGKKMEEYCTDLARERKCAYIELYSSVKRIDAHRFYERQGFKNHEKFFVKEICEIF